MSNVFAVTIQERSFLNFKAQTVNVMHNKYTFKYCARYLNQPVRKGKSYFKRCRVTFYVIVVETVTRVASDGHNSSEADDDVDGKDFDNPGNDVVVEAAVVPVIVLLVCGGLVATVCYWRCRGTTPKWFPRKWGVQKKENLKLGLYLRYN